MVARRCPRYSGPNLLEPLLVVRVTYDAQDSSGKRGTAITARFSLHKYELKIVFYDGIRLVGFAQKRRAVALRLEYSVRNLVPDDRRQVIVANVAAVLLNGCMERN